jgi:CRP-like cAMP-binding protein
VAIEMSSGLSGPVTIEHLSAGDILGWSAFQHPYKWSLDSLSTDDCRFLAFDAHELRHLCHDDPARGSLMLQRIIDVVAHRLRAARLQLLDFYA